MEKGTPLREETSTLGSESDEEERTVGYESLSTSSRELSDISDSPVRHTYSGYINVKVRPKESTGRPAASETVMRHGRTKTKKKESVNESDE